MNREELLNKIKQAGVVGAGGGGFPAFKKLDANVEHIIANGVECEPLLYKDREVMLQEADKLIAGLIIAKSITGAAKATIAIKRKNSDLINILKPSADKYDIDLFIMENVYPAGDEYILVYDVTGKRIPPLGIPLQVGCVVENVESIINITNAVNDIPVTEKYLTIAGAVNNPVTIKVPIGTSYEKCLEFAGGAAVERFSILTGGVMMGSVVNDLSLSVSKTLSGLIVLPEDHSIVVRKTTPAKVYNNIGHSACDQCSICTQLCPRYILGYPIQPHLVMRSLQMTGDEKDILSNWAQNCCECNVCSLFACPEKLDPKNICTDTKKRLRKENKGFSKTELEVLFNDVHPIRDGREIPISFLYKRLGIKKYDRKADFVKTAPVNSVKIELKNTFGGDAVPCVNPGDVVTKGQMIGKVNGNALATPFHSSIDGRVKEIVNNCVIITSNNS
ncbi:MAG: 4Fe-4S dicluster domain-containing protein [Ignavibacterium sp.]|jgi:Na+-translocating ferredoxin:NAD+ oxidoreductase RnfC subunit|nr:4Fe-4S dicluster domain-containing protein [Ignavibacterium sp.]